MEAKEACGVFGIYALGEEVARLTFFGIFSLQHRGQESAGIATSDGKKIYLHTGMGMVSYVFDEEKLSHLPGHIAIGHNRYSTTGSSSLANAQPLLIQSPEGPLAIAHNGNIINASSLRQELIEIGYRFHTTTDSEVIAYLIASAPRKNLLDKIIYAVHRLQGAFSLVLLTPDKLIGVRDPLGFRPLCLGRLNDSWVLASESSALDHIGAKFDREIYPGEIIFIGSEGVESYIEAGQRRGLCIFEFIYFARPDSFIEGKLLYFAREAMGKELAREHPAEADLVIGVPDSATPAAIGFSQVSGIPLAEGLLKNRYVGRTFIQPDQRLRELGVRLKFNPLPQVISGKRLVVIDDSIVRGTTTPKVVSLLRQAGAKEIHFRICAPPIKYPCFFGVDMPSRWELIAASKSVEEIRRFIGADSLGYQRVEGLLQAVGLPKETFCLACFTGEYPIPIQLPIDKFVLER